VPYLCVLRLWQVRAAAYEVEAGARIVLVVHMLLKLPQLVHLQQQVNSLRLCST
jgi:hypothetical protein